MKRKYNFVGYLPLYGNAWELNGNIDEELVLFEKFFRDYLKLSILSLPIDKNSLDCVISSPFRLKLDFKRVKSRGLFHNKQRYIYDLKRSYKYIPAIVTLEVHLDFNLEKRFNKKDKKLLGKNGIDISFEYEAENIFLMFLENLTIAILIAYPKLLSDGDWLILKNRKMIKKNLHFYTETFLFGFQNFGEKLPSEILTLEQVWSWMANFPDVWTGYSASQMGRVINAIKYLVFNKGNDNDNPITSIIWLIMALETLYLRNVDFDKSKTSELKKRIISFLGDPEKIGLSEKKFSELYNYRSRVLHGDEDFPGTTYFRDSREDRFYTKAYKTSQIVAVVIIKTIQLMIIKKWNYLNFISIVTPSSK